MELFVNGEARQVPDDVQTVAELLDTMQLEATDGTAIAVNEEVIPGSKWGETRIDEGDDIEVIRATQGG
jgi:sulfur carrier protein